MYRTTKTAYDFKRECIENSLYGVDIDAGAVEIAKLRLWLSLIVDEDDIQNIKPLPNLDYKIVCGNSLVGFPENWGSPIEKEIEALIHQHFNETNVSKKNELKIQIDEKIKSRYENSLKAFGYQVNFDFKTVFSEVFQRKGGFDVVIANPPYVRQEEIKELKPTLQKQFECYTGTSDLFVYFFEKGVRLLRENGILTFISSNKYFRSGYGEKLRAYLGTKTRILQVIDFGDAPIFDAIAYPSILVTQKAASNGNTFSALAWKLNEPLERFHETLVTQTITMRQTDLAPNGWRLENQSVLNLLEKLRKAGKPLGEYVNGRLYYGIKTGFNEAFVVDRATRDRLVAEHPSSAEVLKPFLRGRDVKRWKVDFGEQYLIKIESSENKKHAWSGKSEKEAEKVFAKTFPAIHTRFEEFREQLIKRDDQGKYFWELRSCVYWQEFEQPKIIYPDIAKGPEFAFDDNQYHLVNTLYLMPTDQKWLLGLLNSQAVFWFYAKTSSQIRGGFVRFIAQYVSQIPVPVNSDPKPIESLVGQILAAKAKDPTADVSALEGEIDQLVYQLYGLTEEEIGIVEGKGTPPRSPSF
ncbi:MAG: TaqI-like C-terminal specificity domain-containing protein [Dehalococcoidia bacterium]